jgi:hypothetical protein
LYETEEDDLSHPVIVIDLEGTCVSPATSFEGYKRFVVIHPMRKPVYLCVDSDTSRDHWLLSIKNHCCGPGGEVVSAFDEQDEYEFRKAEVEVQLMISSQLTQLKQQLSVSRSHVSQLSDRQRVLAAEVANLEQRAKQLEANTPVLVSAHRSKGEIYSTFIENMAIEASDRKRFVQAAASFFRRMQALSHETIDKEDALLEIQDVREQVESGAFAAQIDEIATLDLDDGALLAADPGTNFYDFKCAELCTLVKVYARFDIQ